VLAVGSSSRSGLTVSRRRRQFPVVFHLSSFFLLFFLGRRLAVIVESTAQSKRTVLLVCKVADGGRSCSNFLRRGRDKVCNTSVFRVHSPDLDSIQHVAAAVVATCCNSLTFGAIDVSSVS
jgi:hypothetical protein